MWEKYNPNPNGARVGDCTVRAIAKATDKDWDDAYTALSLQGFLMKDMPSSNHVFGALLKQNGFVREVVPHTCPDCYTAEDFLADHPRGTFVLVFDNHVAVGQDGILFDTWDSTAEAVQFFWRKED
jgi:hypothetical protein